MFKVSGRGRRTVDHSSSKVDIAKNGRSLPEVNASLIPDAEGALGKCHWWKA